MDDTVLWAYGDCLNASAGTQKACSDDYDFQHYYSRMTLVLEKDETLFVVIAGSSFGTSPTGPYKLVVKQNGSCGDGNVDVGELCDDGNNAPADGCSPTCVSEVSMLEVEPNNGFAMATVVSGQMIHGTIDPSNDEDFFAVTVKETEILTAQLMPSFANSCGIGTTMDLGDVDSEIELLAADGVTSIDYFDGSYCSGVFSGVPTTGTYYLRVAAAAQYCPGCRFAYRLYIKIEDEPAPPAGDPWINEIHYDNAGTDQNEFVEVAGPAGMNLNGWLLVNYSQGNKYSETSLDGLVIPDQQNGMGTIAIDYPTNGLQNGPKDGVALVDGNNGNSVLDFISYEGDFVAMDGQAQGAMSSDILVSESSTTPVGHSLSLTGQGNQVGNFSWAVMSGPHTKGAVNTGQTFQ
jgi:cysteine-rich repeat protein